MTPRAECRTGAAGNGRIRALGLVASLLLTIGCTAIAGCTGPGLEPPAHQTPGAQAGTDAADAGASPRAGSGPAAAGQGGRSGSPSGSGSGGSAAGSAGSRAGAGGEGAAGGPPDEDAGSFDAAMPDAGLPDASVDGGGDAAAAP